MNTLTKTAIALGTAIVLSAAPALAGEVETRRAADIVAADSSLAGRIVQVEVNGMVCDFCAQSLTKVLEKKDSVEKVEISLETKLVTITLKEGMSISDEEVSEAISWAGYDLAGIVRA